MNKYYRAYNVFNTVLNLMYGEEKEDGYKPTQKEMIEAMDVFKELVEKSKSIEVLEYLKKEIITAYNLSEKATDLNNKVFAIWFNNTTLTFDHKSKIISGSHDQWQMLRSLNRLLNSLIMDFENEFILLRYKK
ncbi:hypothetical protein ACTQZR_04690 [Catenibacterium mitsuokai]|uniref:hypothetical protein n=1 Tax=Catenibacterium mitsuokai TaxID=100886 RepID=UPI003F8A9A5F